MKEKTYAAQVAQHIRKLRLQMEALRQELRDLEDQCARGDADERPYSGDEETIH